MKNYARSTGSSYENGWSRWWDGPCLGGSLPASLFARVCANLANLAGDSSELVSSQLGR